MSLEPALMIDATDLSKRFSRDLHVALRSGSRAILDDLLRRPHEHGPLRPTEFWAVEGVSLQVRKGDSLGIVGKNGAGKSTLMRMLAGITRPDRGRVRVRGRVGVLLDPRAGLSPTLTGRESIEVALALSEAPAADRRSRLERIVDFSGIGPYLDDPVRSYSAGMRLRLGFSVQLHLQPDVLLIDEALVVGDVAFQYRCVERLQDFCTNGGALAFVTHSIPLLRSLATSALFLVKGGVHSAGDPTQVVLDYLQDLALEGGATGEHDVLRREAGALLSSAPGIASGNASPEDRVSAHGVTPSEASVDPTDGTGGGDLRSDRPVRTVAVSITGSREEAIRSGERAVVTAEVVSDGLQGDIVWGITIWTPDLILSPVFLSNVTSGPLVLPCGASRLECEVPDLALGPGRYALRFGLFDAESMEVLTLFGYEDEPLYFLVAPPEHNAKVGALPASHIVIEAEWAVDQAAN